MKQHFLASLEHLGHFRTGFFPGLVRVTFTMHKLSISKMFFLRTLQYSIWQKYVQSSKKSIMPMTISIIFAKVHSLKKYILTYIIISLFSIFSVLSGLFGFLIIQIVFASSAKLDGHPVFCRFHACTSACIDIGGHSTST